MREEDLALREPEVRTSREVSGLSLYWFDGGVAIDLMGDAVFELFPMCMNVRSWLRERAGNEE